MKTQKVTLLILCVLLWRCREKAVLPAPGEIGVSKQELVQRGVQFLLHLQRADGAIVSTASPSDSPVGQTAYALRALLLAGGSDPAIQNAIQKAREFLLKSVEPSGLWRYQPFLPPDLDDTTAALSVFSSANSEERALRHKTIRAVLAFQNHNGSLPTWLSDAAALQKLGFSKQQFPIAEVHPEVMAYFFASLAREEEKLFDHERQRAAQYVLSQQQPAGNWKTTWYRSDLYATYRVHHFLSAFSGPQFAEAARRAENYVLKMQRKDGTWGKESPSILDTAFALLVVKRTAAATPNRLARAWEFLMNAQEQNGAWRAEPFFFLDLSQRQSGKAPVFIGNELYSTAIALEAVLARR